MASAMDVDETSRSKNCGPGKKKTLSTAPTVSYQYLFSMYFLLRLVLVIISNLPNRLYRLHSIPVSTKRNDGSMLRRSSVQICIC